LQDEGSKNVFFYWQFTFRFCVVQLKTDEVKHDTSDANSIESLKAAVRRYPDSLMLVQELIEEYRNQNFYDSAILLTDQQIRKDSNNAYLWNIKATLYFESADTMKAIESLEKAIEIFPLPEYLAALGTVYAEIKSKNALMIADELLEKNKTKSAKDAWFIKGLYYNYVNQPEKAITYLDSCLTNDYTYMYAYREKAIALYNLGKYKDAIEVLKRAVTIQNNFDEGYYWLGRCYEKLDKKEEAIESYQNALLYDKNFIEAKTALERIRN
jgi:tetratricopeptide (TPR) repeat protein